MEVVAQGHHDHDHDHQLPTSGGALTAVAVSATLHCLTGCAIGEVAGMAIGTALGFSDWGTVALAVALAFVFGYSLTSVPLLRAGLALAAVVPIALASDTASIAVMEIVDNAIIVVIPGALEAELGDLLFAVVNLARHLEIDPETALRHANTKFERRFRAVEERLAAIDRPVGQASLQEMEDAWTAVKHSET
jgi:hypothetical protein